MFCVPMRALLLAIFAMSLSPLRTDGFEPAPIFDTSLIQNLSHVGSGESSLQSTGDEIQPDDVATLAPHAKFPEVRGTAKRTMDFVLPDGFLLKTLEIFCLRGNLREKIHSGIHKPLEKVTVEIPVGQECTIQIFLNGMPIEERSIR